MGKLRPREGPVQGSGTEEEGLLLWHQPSFAGGLQLRLGALVGSKGTLESYRVFTKGLVTPEAQTKRW